MAVAWTRSVYHGGVSVQAEAAYLKELRTELQRQLGGKVRQLREARGWTQAQLGERIGEVVRQMEPDRPLPFWAQGTAVSRLERGVLAVPLELVEILGRALTVDPVELVESTFSRSPRDADAIARARVRSFERQIGALGDQFMERYSAAMGEERMSRALHALATLGAASEADFDVTVSMIEGLLVHRLEQAASTLDPPDIVTGMGLMAAFFARRQARDRPRADQLSRPS